MIIGIDNIINLIETNKTPYWYVKDFGGSNIIFTGQAYDDEQISLEDSKLKLKSCLETLAPGNYSLEAWQALGQKKNWTKTKFQISGEKNTPVQGFAGIGQLPNTFQQMPQKTVQELISEALEKERTNNKIERLEADLRLKDARIKELEGELNSTETRIGKRVDQIFGPWLDLKEAEKVGTNAAVGSLDEETEAIANLMERWSNADSEFKAVLSGIVKLAEAKDPRYVMGKKMLIENGN